MSKERERLSRRVLERQRFFRHCAALAFAQLRPVQRRWLHAICSPAPENVQMGVLKGFVDAVARQMSTAERTMKPGRGRRPKLEETTLYEIEREQGASAPQAVRKATGAISADAQKKKASALRSRRYRQKKKA